MKKVIFILLFLLPLLGNSQQLEYHDSPLFKFRSWNDEKIFLGTSGALILNGAFKAHCDVTLNNYSYFAATFPGADPRYWNPNVSYKYIPQSFPFRTFLRWTQDGWHLFDTGANSMMYLACTINICNVGNYLKLKPRVIIARSIWNVGMRSIGYNGVDRLLYHHY